MQKVKGIVLVAVGASSYGVLATFVEIAHNNGAYTGVLTFAQFLIGALVLTAICAFKTQDEPNNDIITPLSTPAADSIWPVSGVNQHILLYLNSVCAGFHRRYPAYASHLDGYCAGKYYRTAMG